jgi:hypothetical protein
MAGATPNATRSQRESYSPPNLLVVWVIRAIRPSRLSRTAAIRIVTAAISYIPFMEAITE